MVAGSLTRTMAVIIGRSFTPLLASKPQKEILGKNGDPGMTRTCDLRFRKPPLYPAELRDRRQTMYHVCGGFLVGHSRARSACPLNQSCGSASVPVLQDSVFAAGNHVLYSQEPDFELT